MPIDSRASNAKMDSVHPHRMCSFLPACNKPAAWKQLPFFADMLAIHYRSDRKIRRNTRHMERNETHRALPSIFRGRIRSSLTRQYHIGSIRQICWVARVFRNSIPEPLRTRVLDTPLLRLRFRFPQPMGLPLDPTRCAPMSQAL